MFKKKRGINIDYNKQGLIYFTCLDYKNQPERIQKKILNLCIDIAESDYKALYDVLTSSNKNILSISLEHYISEKKLYLLRKKFYESW